MLDSLHLSMDGWMRLNTNATTKREIEMTSYSMLRDADGKY
jgi:hypothetical protein